MKNTRKALLIIALSLATGGLGTGVTFAATSIAHPDDNFEFAATLDTSDANFQPVSHYFAGGTGLSGSPYLIKNSIHLRSLSKLQKTGILKDGLYFKLASSFTYDGSAMEPIGTSDNPFKGTFDGNGLSIDSLKVSSSDAQVGLFGHVGSGGVVKNLVLSLPSITATAATSAGFFVGNNAGTLQHCYVFGGSPNFGSYAQVKNEKASAISTHFFYGSNTGTASTGLSFISSLSEIYYNSSNTTWTTVPSTACPTSSAITSGTTIAASTTATYYKFNASSNSLNSIPTGYYLIGSDNSWVCERGIPMSASVGNAAEFLGLIVGNTSSKYKIAYWNGSTIADDEHDVDGYYGYSDFENVSLVNGDGDDNFSFKSAGTYNLYLSSSSYKIYAVRTA